MPQRAPLHLLGIPLHVSASFLQPADDAHILCTQVKEAVCALGNLDQFDSGFFEEQVLGFVVGGREKGKFHGCLKHFPDTVSQVCVLTADHSMGGHFGQVAFSKVIDALPGAILTQQLVV
uniref:Uncharacterized protein n=1 Tax=Anguilla anguilla TaxID=7936 RepID=A0A0E9XY38_ANGAN